MTCYIPDSAVNRQAAGGEAATRTDRHHGARRLARHKHLAGIAIVLLQRILDHVRQPRAVAAAIVGQALLRRDVPARAVRRCLAVDEHVAEPICQLAVLGGSEEGAGRPGAGVQHQHHGRLRLQFGRDIDEHLDARRVVAEILHLRERGPLNELRGLGGGNGGGLGARKGHQARHQAREVHLGRRSGGAS